MVDMMYVKEQTYMQNSLSCGASVSSRENTLYSRFVHFLIKHKAALKYTVFHCICSATFVTKNDVTPSSVVQFRTIKC